VPITQLVE